MDRVFHDEIPLKAVDLKINQGEPLKTHIELCGYTSVKQQDAVNAKRSGFSPSARPVIRGNSPKQDIRHVHVLSSVSPFLLEDSEIAPS